MTRRWEAPGTSDLDRVLVLAGGLSAEREVSLRSGQRVAAALRDAGVDVAICDVGVDLLRILVKPRAGGSAFGVSAVSEPGQLATALMGCFGYHDNALIERAIPGTEVTVGVIDLDGEPIALPAVEIVPDGGVYDYAARYTAGAAEFFCPSRLPAPAERAARDAALAAHRALGLRDLSRTDMIVDKTGRVFVLETNVAPGMTDTSTFPIALAAAGYDFAVICRDLAARAVERARPRPRP